MIRTVRTRTIFRILSLTLAVTVLWQIFFPSVAWALTGGPSQPEVQSFEPVGTTQMVNLFTGDFTYNIPLLDVGGYPVNLSYHAGPTMDQEASWVGLGWNVNPGVINRNVRGIPDDFNEDVIKREFNLEPNWTVGASIGLGFEIYGALGFGFGAGMNYNNYVGVGFETSISLAGSVGMGGNTGLTAGLGLTSSSQGGATFTPSLSLSMTAEDKKGGETDLSLGFSLPINSRKGIETLTIGGSAGYKSPLGRGGGLGATAQVSFVSPTYTPQIKFSMENYAFTGKFNIGGTVYGADVSADFVGYFSHQSLRKTKLENKAYGYYHLDGAIGSGEPGYKLDQDALLDFNREKDRGFTKSTPNLPVTVPTYDLLGVSGQGVGGQYRGYRGDLGYVYDNYADNTSTSISIGAEITLGNLVHGGGDVNVTQIDGKSGQWKNRNDARPRFRYANESANKQYEPFYIRQVGEKSVEDDGQYLNSIFRDTLIAVKLGGSGASARAEAKFALGPEGDIEPQAPNTTDIPLNGIKRSIRSKRNQTISYLTIDQAAAVGLQPSLYDYDDGVVFDERTSTSEERPNGHHIGEVTVIRPDGTRYVYGIPAYNTSKNEVSFSMAEVNDDDNDGLVNYYPGTDNTLGNNRGRDNYFNKTTTPPYAHSYLLTAIVSADYVDSDDVVGPSRGDMGTYTLFSYEKVHDDYQWRVPAQKDQATFDRGILPRQMDNKGHYIHGSKQIFYLDTVKTRTQTAIFEKSDRNDSRGVIDENGGVVSYDGAVKKLDRIKLYSTPDLEQNETNAVPIKTVHFDYGYDLCQGVPNYHDGTSANGGKLTLKKVWFTYGNSNKGRYSPYSFAYSPINPDYNIKAYDRWGNYMPEGTGDVCPTCTPATPNLSASTLPLNMQWPPNAEWPYTDQGKFGPGLNGDDIENEGPVYEHMADVWANAWNLTEISLPSGGKINVEYESDDYAYVQNESAGRMFQIVGVGTSNTSKSTDNTLFTSPATVNYDVKEYLYFKLADGDENLTQAEFEEKYFSGDYMDNLYFRCLTDLHPKEPPNAMPAPEARDYVTGYLDVDQVYKLTGVDAGYGAIKVHKVDRDKGNVPGGVDHPISWAAWQFGRMHCPNVVYEQAEFAGDPEGILQAFIGSSFMATLPELFEGPNNFLRKKKVGDVIDVSGNSWIRLRDPSGYKQGGGHRVSKIAMSDQWSDISGDGVTATYGQEYDYSNGAKSSGVAAWEPILGGEENPLRKPQAFSEGRLLAPDGKNYQESPYGESFYPAPVVGYSRVKVTSVKPENFTITAHANGAQVHEFYTARDFPTKNTRTEIQTEPFRTTPVNILGFSTTAKEHMTASQGFLVELNDMHGKPKAVSVYSESNGVDPVSATRYFYKNDGDRLNNLVTTVSKNENSSGDRVEQKEVGVEYDAIADFRRSINKTHSGGAQINVASMLFGMFPGVIPTVWPSYSYSEVKFQSATVTKVINRFGLIDHVEVEQDGSIVKTYNEAWDAETGEVLLTRTNNGFGDDIYSFSYPAHWAYDRMGSAYRNIGVLLDLTENGSSGSYDIETGIDDDPLMCSGDELLVGDANADGIQNDGEVFERYWLWDHDEGSQTPDDEMYIIDADGDPVSGLTKARIIRSGRRNMQALPIGTIVSYKQSPIQDGDIDLELAINQGEVILAASASEYSEDWQTECYSCPFLKGDQSESCHLSIDIVQNGDVLSVQNLPQATYLWSNASEGVLLGETSHTLQVTSEVVEDYSVQVNISDCSSTAIKEDVDKDASVTEGDPDPIISNFNYDVSQVNNASRGVNPYLMGLRGNWRPKKSYSYLADRSTSINPEAAEYRTWIKANGTIRTVEYNEQTESSSDHEFVEFWTAPGQTGDWTKTSEANDFWQWVSEVTRIDGFGNEVENRDPLEESRYSSAQFGYGGSLPIAVASNSRYSDMAFAHFEDDGFEGSEGEYECLNGHFPVPGHRSSERAHSGLHSLTLPAQSSVSLGYYNTYEVDCDESLGGVPFLVGSGSCDCVGRFAPYTYTTEAEGPKFLLSFWVSENHGGSEYVTDYATDVVLGPNSGYPQEVVTLETTRGPIIDEWQQVSKVFQFEPGEENLEIVFNTGSTVAYVDDIRIQPFNSSMKGYVYHPETLRLMAELDENNYATFYEYDEEGKLARVKKETERGVMTIQESRGSMIKIENNAP